MKIKKRNAELIWKQFEDLLVPRLRLSVIDRAVYSRLLRHSRMEGKLRLRFSIAWLARGARLSNNPARNAVRRLVDHDALRLVDRTKAGHVVEVRLPDEVRAARPGPSAPRCQPRGDGFHENQGSPPAIHSRECGPLLLLSAPPYRPRAHPRPCRAARRVGAQFLPQPRLLLSGMQLEKGAQPRRGFPPLALPQAPASAA